MSRWASAVLGLHPGKETQDARFPASRSVLVVCHARTRSFGVRRFVDVRPRGPHVRAFRRTACDVVRSHRCRGECSESGGGAAKHELDGQRRGDRSREDSGRPETVPEALDRNAGLRASARPGLGAGLQGHVESAVPAIGFVRCSSCWMAAPSKPVKSFQGGIKLTELAGPDGLADGEHVLSAHVCLSNRQSVKSPRRHFRAPFLDRQEDSR